MTSYPVLTVTTFLPLLGAFVIVLAGDRLRLTPEGWLRLDALVAHLTRYRVGP